MATVQGAGRPWRCVVRVPACLRTSMHAYHQQGQQQPGSSGIRLLLPADRQAAASWLQEALGSVHSQASSGPGEAMGQRGAGTTAAMPFAFSKRPSRRQGSAPSPRPQNDAADSPRPEHAARPRGSHESGMQLPKGLLLYGRTSAPAGGPDEAAPCSPRTDRLAHLLAANSTAAGSGSVNDAAPSLAGLPTVGSQAGLSTQDSARAAAWPVSLGDALQTSAWRVAAVRTLGAGAGGSTRPRPKSG